MPKKFYQKEILPEKKTQKINFRQIFFAIIFFLQKKIVKKIFDINFFSHKNFHQKKLSPINSEIKHLGATHKNKIGIG